MCISVPLLKLSPFRQKKCAFFCGKASSYLSRITTGSNLDGLPALFQLRSWRMQLMVQKSGDHQLRLVVYPIIYDGFYTSKRWFSRRISGCHQQLRHVAPCSTRWHDDHERALSHHKVVELGHQPNGLTTHRSAFQCLEEELFTLHSDQDCLGSRQNRSLKPGTWQQNTRITSILNHLQSNLQEHPASCCLFWLFDHFATRKFQHLKHLSQCQILSSSKFLHVQCCISLRDLESGVLQLSVEVEIHQECPNILGRLRVDLILM